MDGYGVKFGVVSGDYEARGSYVVEGDSYYLVLGDAEVSPTEPCAARSTTAAAR